jgi:flavodoxin
MKSIIIYYSLEGNTRYTAETLAKILDSDLLELQPTRPIKSLGFSKYIWGGKQVVMNEKPKLKPYKFDPDKYDLVILASPIWASHFAPAFSTFLKDNAINGNIALIACNEGGGCAKAFNMLEQQLKNNKIIGTLDLITPLKNKESTIEKLKEFSQKLI